MPGFGRMAECATLFRPTLAGPIPDRTNEVFRCTSSLTLNISSQDIHLKTCIQLLFPNKALGGNGVLVLSSSLASFLESTRIMLRSLELSESESRLFKLREDSEIIKDVTKELDEVKGVVEALLVQFKRMH
jgi:hypothetical protein